MTILELLLRQAPVLIEEAVVAGVHICHLAHPMVLINLECIRLGSQCLVSPFLHFMVVPHLNPMPFQLVELYMDLLELFLMSLHQEAGGLVLGVAMLVLLLAVIFHTSKVLSKLLGILALLLTFLLWRIQIASHPWVVHYLNPDLLLICQYKVRAKHFVMDFLLGACRRISWVMILKARVHMYLIMLQTSPHRLLKVGIPLIMLHKERRLGFQEVS